MSSFVSELCKTYQSSIFAHRPFQELNMNITAIDNVHRNTFTLFPSKKWQIVALIALWSIKSSIIKRILTYHTRCRNVVQDHNLSHEYFLLHSFLVVSIRGNHFQKILFRGAAYQILADRRQIAFWPGPDDSMEDDIWRASSS